MDSYKSNNKAFTLVEVLLVVVLIALLAGAGGGMMLGTYKNMLAKKAARDFLLAANYARILAVERQKPCRMQLDAINNRILLMIDTVNLQTGEIEQVAIRDEYFKPVSFGRDVKFEHIKIESNELEQTEDRQNRTITYYPNGTSQSAVVQIGDGKNHYTASILAATGKAKIDFGTAENITIGSIDLDE